MIFKDRQEAGTKLLLRILTDKEIQKNTAKFIVVSLLRGGVVIGDIIAKGLEAEHLPLVVTKIPAPDNPELALGAICFNTVYLEKAVVEHLGLTVSEMEKQIAIAQAKFGSYLNRFAIRESDYAKKLTNQVVILIDDGIATGSTVKVSVAYLRSNNPKSIILAVPVAPSDFSLAGLGKKIILHKKFAFGAVSQFYEYFPQVEDKKVKEILRGK